MASSLSSISPVAAIYYYMSSIFIYGTFSSKTLSDSPHPHLPQFVQVRGEGGEQQRAGLK